MLKGFSCFVWFWFFFVVVVVCFLGVFFCLFVCLFVFFLVFGVFFVWACYFCLFLSKTMIQALMLGGGCATD